MIQRLNTPNLAFRANSSNPYSRKAYEDVVQKNNAIAQEQNAKAVNNVQKQSNQKQIPMQGVGEKLDVTA